MKKRAIFHLSLILFATDLLLQILSLTTQDKDTYAITVMFPASSIMIPLILSVIYSNRYEKLRSYKKCFLAFLTSSFFANAPFALTFILIGFATMSTSQLLSFEFLGIFPLIIGRALYVACFSLLGLSLLKVYKSIKARVNS